MNTRLVETPNGKQIVLSTVPPPIEDAILLSFGHSIIEFEATLYEKFLRLTNGVVITHKEFKKHLKNMNERGLMVSTDIMEKQCRARSLND